MGKAKKAKEAALKNTRQDDKSLWEAVKASAKPVRRDTIFRDSLGTLEKATPPAAKVSKTKRAAPFRAPSTVLPPARPNPKPHFLSHGCAPGVDRRTAERLHKGKMSIEGRLDLHGMSRDAAHQATLGFVTNARLSGKRCILIVTGKGKGILQSDLPHWLNLPPLRDQILSFSHARPQDGGSGAVYVLLKRDRGISG
ncbi:Smr/MutS family protein [Hwanghaeella sp. LZ110]|uniref:Smr/MutS family protein n=1 Tax=Hwanghaeella sp. LZ110 TaxID=3402810 RepID=UPI003B6703ED